MMFSKLNLNSLLPSTTVQSYSNTTPAESRPVTQHFDQIEISNRPTGEEKRILDLASRLAREVRTRPTRAELESLKEQVQSGSYTPDPREIAASMLLVDEEEL